MHMALGKESPRVGKLQGWKSQSSKGSLEICLVLWRGPIIRGTELMNHSHWSALSVGSAAHVLRKDGKIGAQPLPAKAPEHEQTPQPAQVNLWNASKVQQ